MLNFHDVPVITMFKFFDYGFLYDMDNYFFKKLNIKTVRDFEYAMEKYPSLFSPYLCKEGKKLLLKVRKIEEKYVLKNPNEISYFQNLDMICDKTRETSEENTKCDELLLYSLVGQNGRSGFNGLIDLNVSQIKKLFYYQDSSSSPLILQAAKIGTKNLQSIINAINLFDEQLIRQNDEEHTLGDDLFHLNYEEKKAIVLEEIESYISYLEENAKNCVWGPNNEIKIRYMKEALILKSVAAIRNRERIINTFTNYLTLSELEKGVVKNKTLERFIIN